MAAASLREVLETELYYQFRPMKQQQQLVWQPWLKRNRSGSHLCCCTTTTGRRSQAGFCNSGGKSDPLEGRQGRLVEACPVGVVMKQFVPDGICFKRDDGSHLRLCFSKTRGRRNRRL